MFRELDLSSIYNMTRSSTTEWQEHRAVAVGELQSGRQNFWGVTFDLGPVDNDLPALIVAGSTDLTAGATVAVAGTATYLVFAHFCDSRAHTTVAGQTADYPVPVVTAPGEHLADYVLVYTDGSTAGTPIRRRFEVNQVRARLQSGFVCRHQEDLTPLSMHGPYPENMWGRFQMEVSVGPAITPLSPRDDLNSRRNVPASWSIYALPNPHAEKEIAELRIEPTGAASIGIGAVTLFLGTGHPLRYRPLETFAIKLENGVDAEAGL